MAIPPDPASLPDAVRSTGCSECGAELAHDQAYCLECGARRGLLPAAIAKLINPGAGPPEHPPAFTEPVASPAPDEALTESSLLAGRTMPTPRVAAVAAMGLLAFGVVLGSVVGPTEQSAATPPLVVAAAPVTPSPVQAPAATDTPTTPDAAPTPVPTPAVVATPAPASAQPAANAPSTPPGSLPPAGGAEPPAITSTRPPVKHVFVIVLSDHGFDAAFGPSSTAPYLASTLRAQGELLPNYYAVTHGALANGIALLSGQGPNPQTAANCPTYSDLTPGTAGDQNQASGSGCVYPPAVSTLADQLTADSKTGKGYIEDIGNGGPNRPSTCRHPAPGGADSEQAPRPGDAYVTWRNPLVYFHSFTDKPVCASNDVGLDQLPLDLKTASQAPAFAYIVPSRCHDGAEQPCASGQPSGLAATDVFLRKLVPEITGSAAYQDGGLLAITFDQAPQSGTGADSSACCGTPTYPNMPAGGDSPPPSARTASSSAPPQTSTTPTSTTPTSTTPTTASGAPGSAVTPTGGGGRVGLLLISPFVKPGTVDQTAYNHFSLLRSIQDLFGYTPLGYAAQSGLPSFDRDVYNAYRPTG